MTKSLSWWSSLYLRFNPSTWIEIKHMSVIQVYITLLCATIIMTSKVKYRSTNQGSGVATSCTWWNTFNLRESPKPWSLLFYSKWSKLVLFDNGKLKCIKLLCQFQTSRICLG
jgi:hypothetical protein